MCHKGVGWLFVRKEVSNDVADGVYIVLAEVVKHRQTHQAIGITVAFAQYTPIMFWSIIRTAMQTQIMEYRQHTIVFQPLNQCGTLF